MTFVMMVNSALYRVDEPYEDVVSAMDGPDLVEFHTDGDPLTVRAVNVLATAANIETLLQQPAPPIAGADG